MGILDTLTGGSSKSAKEALRRAQDAYASIATPTAADLTLPELQKYVEAGILTPAQAQAALQETNAFNDIKLDPNTLGNQQDALSKLKAVGDAEGMTPQMKAQLTEALDQVATNTRGTNAAISDQFAQRGIPSSLMAEAAMREEAGSNARNANLAATQAAGNAEQNAIQAMLAQGNLASTMRGQQSSEAENRAAAENAMQQWNAGATNTANLTNAGYQQAANEYNTSNKQNISNTNTGTANQRTAYNAQVPQMVFKNQMDKAGGIAGVSRDQANQATESGNQMMGLIGAGIGAGATALKKADGGMIPGEAEVPGDSPENDKVPAMLSPGEVVIPRSVAPNPEAVKRFVQNLAHGKQPQKPVHPHDVHAVLEALTMRRA